MNSRRIHARLLVAAAAALIALGSAQANNFSKGAYDGAKSDIENNYKAEREGCNGLAGNAKDVCVEQVKGREKVAMAQLEFNYTGSSKDEMKLYEARYEARYDYEKERCDDLAGNAKDVCVRQAKTSRDKAKADVKMAKSINAAVDDATAARMKADYKLASAKCDALSGDSKDSCMASAKARFNERW